MANIHNQLESFLLKEEKKLKISKCNKFAIKLRNYASDLEEIGSVRSRKEKKYKLAMLHHKLKSTTDEVKLYQLSIK